MLFTYKALTKEGEKKEGTIDAINKTVAISALQERGLIVVAIKGNEDKKSFLSINLWQTIPLRDVVILSRQIATLFEAQISALKTFTLLASSTENKLLSKKLNQVADDLQAGSSISGALSRHPEVFSSFYVNMVKSGEESGKLNQVFMFMADYLDRQYALNSKARNALIYPVFVIVVFLTVMILMFTMVIPNLSKLLIESGQEIPFYTKIVIAISDFILNYGIFLLIFVVLLAGWAWYMSKSPSGKRVLDSIKLSLPIAGNLYKKLYLARIADNLNTMLSSGISIVRSIEVTSEVAGSQIYADIMSQSAESVKAGEMFSNSLKKYEEMPGIFVQMIQVGEETGSLGAILKTLAVFYKREVDDAVDTLIGLIEPFMIICLGLGVGVLLVSILVPIYNIATSI